MPAFRTGTVEAVVEEFPGIQVLEVRLDDEQRRAVLYTRYAAPAKAGDRVVLNTTADDLRLGSGGEDFVVWNLAHDTYESPQDGHVMKLRYTPLQTEVMAVEAPESPHHGAMASASGLEGMPVLAASLHSQLLPVVAAVRSKVPGARIAYVMTDGGALEASLSRTTRRLRELGWLATVVTVGHATGGDLEAVNLYSGLLAARAIASADITVAGMGPGVVGTATPFGTTALELGMTLNATASLGGKPVAVVRMSSADVRDRHAGISHHALTALMRVALARADVPVPSGHAGGLGEAAMLHNVVEVDAESVIADLERARAQGLLASHMGRGPEEDRLFFLAAGAAGLHAAGYLEEGKDA
ncbi:MAG TPA: DUF3866 family protein [Actinomycetota bacterium]|nr:DUF3866 family protein [Actinomycetota bacterium]